ncbi:phospholipase [Peribacillus sp. SCS-155]|uniref:phospholipase n=1 Tax=Peribacillus sedimenti TaxID=3115297 RepID=UPI0039063B0C
MARTIGRKTLFCRCIFPRYKWCGPGCSGPEDPINDVDDCCKSHDQCYQQESRCQCDRNLINCLRTKVNFYSRKGFVAALIYFYMRIQVLFTCSLIKKE